MCRSSHSKITPRSALFRDIWAAGLSVWAAIVEIFLFSYEYLVTLVAWGYGGFPHLQRAEAMADTGYSCRGFHSQTVYFILFVISGWMCSTLQVAAVYSLFLSKNWLGWTLRAAIYKLGCVLSKPLCKLSRASMSTGRFTLQGVQKFMEKPETCWRTCEVVGGGWKPLVSDHSLNHRW